MTAPIVSAMRARLGDLGWGPLVGFVIAAVATWPVVHAGFHPEDFGWLAVARRIDSPWPLLTSNIPFNYFYRPIPLLFWWFSTQAFGTAAIWHNIADVLIHACNAAFVGVLAVRATRQRTPGWIAAVLFAALPAATATAGWMSDRFDTIALLFSLLAMLALEKSIAKRSSPWIVVLMLSLALLSKEIAYVVAAVMLVRLIILWPRRDRTLVALLAGVVGSVVLTVVLRFMTVAPLDTSLNTNDMSHAFWAGTVAWWAQSSDALNGFQSSSNVLEFAVAISLVIAIIAIGRDVWRGRRSDLALAVIALGLLVLPAFVQWPVTQYALVRNENLAFPENLRFYYFAAAGLALLVATGYARLRTGWARVVMSGLCAVAVVCAFGLSRQVSKHWAHSWRLVSDISVAVGRDLNARSFPPRCRIYLDTENWPLGFQKHVDTMVKAVADPTASVQDCAVFAGAVATQTLLPNGQCDAALWPGLVVREHDGIPLVGRFGNLCVIPFANREPEKLGTPLFRFRVDAGGHVSAESR